MKVHYASGTHPFPGWTNVDYTVDADVQIDLISDEWPGLQGVTDSYVGHFLEHLTREEGIDFLLKVRARSVPGGRLTVVGPDVVKAQRWYNNGAMSRDLYLATRKHGTLTGSNRGDVHVWDCTGFEVVEMLKEAGWSRVVELPISRMDGLLPGVPVIDKAGWQFLVVAYADNTGPDFWED